MIASSIILQDSAGAISLQMSLALWLHTYCCLWRLYKKNPHRLEGGDSGVKLQQHHAMCSEPISLDMSCSARLNVAFSSSVKRHGLPLTECPLMRW